MSLSSLVVAFNIAVDYTQNKQCIDSRSCCVITYGFKIAERKHILRTKQKSLSSYSSPWQIKPFEQDLTIKQPFERGNAEQITNSPVIHHLCVFIISALDLHSEVSRGWHGLCELGLQLQINLVVNYLNNQLKYSVRIRQAQSVIHFIDLI